MALAKENVSRADFFNKGSGSCYSFQRVESGGLLCPREDEAKEEYLENHIKQSLLDLACNCN